jgi:hypothetical protein
MYYAIHTHNTHSYLLIFNKSLNNNNSIGEIFYLFTGLLNSNYSWTYYTALIT